MGFGMFVFVLLLAAIYFAPTILALITRHKYAAPILIINLFLGWTLLGWVGSLAWAFAGPVAPKTEAPQAAPAVQAVPVTPKAKPPKPKPASLSIYDQDSTQEP